SASPAELMCCCWICCAPTTLAVVPMSSSGCSIRVAVTMKTIRGSFLRCGLDFACAPCAAGAVGDDDVGCEDWFAGDAGAACLVRCADCVEAAGVAAASARARRAFASVARRKSVRTDPATSARLIASLELCARLPARGDEAQELRLAP